MVTGSLHDSPGASPPALHAFVQWPPHQITDDLCDQENTADVTVCDFQGQGTTGITTSGLVTGLLALGQASHHAERTLKPPLPAVARDMWGATLRQPSLAIM